ncbi:hypothetical protein PP182_12870 [Maribacter sp. PR1]|uniref:Uncharacterized protein n=1 Tax=Maribacter cobaltidurans TaxID=1178778 RepID=A0ABU7IVF6_9FLAO|nr:MULTISPECIES: hypothetical protein [Maribacter]MDC6389583.1 hypothetical protein [Maribacter sp. PR1]MEE1976972.1 hypothetical protein [Maribacter cobaltidurans]
MRTVRPSMNAVLNYTESLAAFFPMGIAMYWDGSNVNGSIPVRYRGFPPL